MRRLLFEPLLSAIIALGVGAMVAIVANTSAWAGKLANSNGTPSGKSNISTQIRNQNKPNEAHDEPNGIKVPGYGFSQLRLRPDGRADIYGHGQFGAAVIVTVEDRVLGQSAVDSRGKWHISTSAATRIGAAGRNYDLQLLAYEPRADDLHVVDELQITLPVSPRGAVALASAGVNRAQRQGKATPSAQTKALQTAALNPHTVLERSSSMIVTASPTSKNTGFVQLAQIETGGDGGIGLTVRDLLGRAQRGYRSVVEKLADKPGEADERQKDVGRQGAAKTPVDGKGAEDVVSGGRRSLPAGATPATRLAGKTVETRSSTTNAAAGAQTVPVDTAPGLLAQSTDDGPLDLVRKWYERSDKSFRDVMRKLSVDGETLRRARKRSKDGKTAAGKRRDDDETGSGLVRLLQSVLPMEWWKRIRKDYQSTVGKLARKPKERSGEPITAKAPDIGPRDNVEDAAKMADAKTRQDKARREEFQRAKEEARRREQANAEAARKRERQRQLAQERAAQQEQAAQEERLAEQKRMAEETRLAQEEALRRKAEQQAQREEAERIRLAEEQSKREAQAQALALAREKALAKARQEAKAKAEADAKARADAAAAKKIEAARARAELKAQQERRRAQTQAKRQQQERRARAQLNRRVEAQKRKYAAQQRRLARQKALKEQRLAEARAQAKAAEAARAEEAAKRAAAKKAKAERLALAKARAEKRREEKKAARAARAASAAAARAEARARKAAVEMARAEKLHQEQQLKMEAARRAAADAVQKKERQRAERRLLVETRKSVRQQRDADARRRDLERSKTAARTSRSKSRQAEVSAKAAGTARRASEAAKSDEARQEADRKFSFSIREAKEAAANAIEAARAKIAAREGREKRLAQGLPPRQTEEGSTPGDDLGEDKTDRAKARKKNIVRPSTDNRGVGDCEDAGVRVELPGWYVVRRGDTLRTIARRHYRSTRARRLIHRANHNRIDDLKHLDPCTRLRLPLPEPAG